MEKYIMVGGDAYSVPVKIKQGATVITPSICDGVKIKIGKIEQSYPSGGVTFDSINETWLFPVTQEQTRELANEKVVNGQVQAKIRGEVFGSKSKPVNVAQSIINEDWSE